MPFLYVGACLAIVFLFAALRGAGLKSTCRTVSSRRVPAAFDGFRIVVVSDLHDRRFGQNGEAVLRRVRDLRPDVILIPGDMHNAGCRRLDYAVMLGELAKIAPSYAVTGNHEPDPSERPREYASWLETVGRTGVRLLDDESVVLTRNGSQAVLSGRSWQSRAPFTPSDAFSIRLVHSPEVFDEAGEHADLTVCGHVHGGFLVLPLIGAVFAPGEGKGLRHRFSRRSFFPKYYKGLYERDGKILYVSEGLGFTAFPPMRFIRGEVGEIILKSKNF